MILAAPVAPEQENIDERMLGTHLSVTKVPVVHPSYDALERSSMSLKRASSAGELKSRISL